MEDVLGLCEQSVNLIEKGKAGTGGGCELARFTLLIYPDHCDIVCCLVHEVGMFSHLPRGKSTAMDAYMKNVVDGGSRARMSWCSRSTVLTVRARPPPVFLSRRGVLGLAIGLSADVCDAPL